MKIQMKSLRKTAESDSLRSDEPWEPARIAAVMLSAGQIALRHFRRTQWTLKADRSLVTVADTEVEAYLRSRLEAPEDGFYMLGEESADTLSEEYLAQAYGHFTWVVDPIDGTAPYANGLVNWGVSLGLMETGMLRDGAILLPAQGEFFITVEDQVWWASGVDVEAPLEEIEWQILEPRHQPLSDGGMVGLSQVISKGGVFERPNPIQATGSAVCALTSLVLGRYMATIAHIKIWDLAGVLPILLRCGYVAELLNGTRLTAAVDEQGYALKAGDPRRWYLQDGCIFAPPEMIAELRKAIRIL
jgi:fructose-1,6-bisphosphatase/inositol monophosphatase family enzyme